MKRMMQETKWKFKKLLLEFQRLRIEAVIMVPVVLALLIMLWVTTFGKQIEGTFFQGILFAIIFFLFGCVGLIVIIRKEVPFVEGIAAEIIGWLLLLLAWGFALIIIIQDIKNLY